MRKQNRKIKRTCLATLAICCVAQLAVVGQPAKPYPPAISSVLTEAKANRPELEKALNYMYATGDSLKIKSIDFLLSNISIHSSADYYWADNSNHRVSYNEANYSSAKEAASALEALSSKYG